MFFHIVFYSLKLIQSYLKQSTSKMKSNKKRKGKKPQGYMKTTRLHEKPTWKTANKQELFVKLEVRRIQFSI